MWAHQATSAGAVTKEGHTAYAAGAWVVSNKPDGSDAYAITDEQFRAMYDPLFDGG